MSSPSSQPIVPLSLSEKEIKCHGVQLLFWLWPNTELDLWSHKLAFGKTLADVTFRLPMLALPDVPMIRNWAMCVAIMLNGPKHICEDDIDPFNIQAGKSPELQAWRMLAIHSLALLPGEGYLMSNAARIALNTLERPYDGDHRASRDPVTCGADIVHYLNHQGSGNSIAWFRDLDVMQHQAALADAMSRALHAWQQSFACFSDFSPKAGVFDSRLTRQKLAVQILINAAPNMIPRALQEIALLLQPLQASIPAKAEKQLGARASAPYQPRTTIPNPDHLRQMGRAEITAILHRYGAGLFAAEGKA